MCKLLWTCICNIEISLCHNRSCQQCTSQRHLWHVVASMWRSHCFRNIKTSKSIGKRFFGTIRFSLSTGSKIVLMPKWKAEIRKYQLKYFVRRSSSVLYNSCFSGFDSATLLCLNYGQISVLGWIQTSKTGGPPYSDISPCVQCEYSQHRWLYCAKTLYSYNFQLGC